MAVVKSKIEGKLNKEITSFLKDAASNHYIVKHYHVELNQRITYHDFFADKMLIIAAIRTGIPYTLFSIIQDYTPFTENDWADFLDVSTKSLQRYKQASKYHFKPIHSEKIIEMAEVTTVGLDVFGNIDKLKQWLNTPSYALGSFKPIELLKDSYGKELVMNELTRINHGILV